MPYWHTHPAQYLCQRFLTLPYPSECSILSRLSLRAWKSNIPRSLFFIEGNDSTTELKLKGLAHLISDNIISADSADRKRLHLASVFACNFTNRLMGIAKEILSESGIDFRVMLPLLRQTISKLDNMTPEEAQTGPAVRNDFGVMDAHIKMLEGDQELQQLYRIFSNQIIKHSES